MDRPAAALIAHDAKKAEMGVLKIIVELAKPDG